MTFRERLLAVFAGKRPDHLPWFGDLGYWRHAHALAGDLPEQYHGNEGYVRLHRDYHCGMYLGFTGVYGARSQADITTDSQRDGDRITTTYTAPFGSMTGLQMDMPFAGTTAWLQYPVRTPGDLRLIRYLYESQEIYPNFDPWLEGDRLTGDQGIHIAAIPRGGISSLLAEWCGVTNLSYLLADARPEVEKTVEVMLARNAAIIDVICQSPAPLVEFCDNLTGEVVTRLFRDYQFDFYTEQIKKLHAHGKKTLSHVDGTLRGILPLMAATGLDAAESVTPMPCGDVAIEDLRELAGPDLILFGGMPGAMFAPPFTADDIKRQVETIIEHHWAYNKFVLGAADQVPPNADMNLVRLTGELCEQLTG
ncbi:MAG: uroporphyrinogen decarboxylase family protein [Armatimonadia bacterium]